MIQRKPKGDAARLVYGAVLAVGFAVTLFLNFPGHLSVDSVISLTQARSDVRVTWAPASFAWLLSMADALVAGTGLYITLTSAVLFLSLWALTGLRDRASWLAPVLAVLLIATPHVLVYQGIVWRDVLFANLSVAGFVFLAHAARVWGSRRALVWVAGAILCLALAATVRQNGLVLALAAFVALGWTARGGGVRSMLLWGFGGLAAWVLIAFAIVTLAEPPTTAKGTRSNAEVLILQHYDVVGAVARQPDLKLAQIAKVAPKAATIIETQGPKYYSATRIDYLDRDPALGRAMWRTPDAAMHAQWLEIVLDHPLAYLKHRADVFRWLVSAPDVLQCVPVYVGVSGPPAMMATLGLKGGYDRYDQAQVDYAARFFSTPVFSHATWIVVGVIVGGLLLMRREPADMIIVAMLVGALGFAASFFVISVACDYRYLYPLDLTVIAALLYLALDPPFRRKGKA